MIYPFKPLRETLLAVLQVWDSVNSPSGMLPLRPSAQAILSKANEELAQERTRFENQQARNARQGFVSQTIWPDDFERLRDALNNISLFIASPNREDLARNLNEIKEQVDATSRQVILARQYRGEPWEVIRASCSLQSVSIWTAINRTWPNTFRPNVIQFCQQWGSTCLGFSGLIGGAAITNAITSVVALPDGSACVYFGKSLGYRVLKPNALFHEHVRDHALTGQASMAQYELSK